jgi:hypothetical protein
MGSCPLSTKGQGALDHEANELVKENFMVVQFFKKGEAYTMDGRKHSKPFGPS